MDFITLNVGSTSTALAGGNVRVFGTSAGDETVTLVTPVAGQTLTVSFDGSFNLGGDTIVFAGSASDYTIVQDSSGVIISGNGITATVPAGPAGTDIVFGDSDPLTLAIDTTAGAIVLGDQTVTDTATAIGGGGGGTPTPPPPPASGDDILFTVGQDNLTGTDGDDTFVGRIVQNTAGTGAVTNTFDSGDIFDGGLGTDTARISLTSVVTGDLPIGPAISSESQSVEQFFIRTQFDNLDTAGITGSSLTESLQLGTILTSTDFDDVLFGAANIDAQLNVGVQQWWSENARADLIIEDIRDPSQSVIFGFRDSDPGVSYAAFFDPEALNSAGRDSQLTLTLRDDFDPTRDLEEFPVNGVRFTLGGEEFTVTVDRGSPENLINSTYEAFTARLNEQLDATPGLETVTAVFDGTDQITLTDADGRSFEAGSYTFVDGVVPGNGDLLFRQDVGAPIQGPISTTILLDGVGRGEEGGLIAVGSMGQTDGVEQFNVLVEDTSHVQAMLSTNNILETVIVSHVSSSSNGDLFIGSATQNPDDNFVTGNFGLAISTTTDDRLSTTGLSDVQTFDAEGFRETLFVGAQITIDSFDKYLEGATEEVPFLYHLGDGGSNLTISIDPTVQGDEDFGIDIIGGDMNDRVNLVLGDNRKDNIDIDLEGGDNNIVELNTSTSGGTSRFEGFENVDTLVVAGVNNTVQDITNGNMLGLSSILISTGIRLAAAGDDGKLASTGFNPNTDTIIGAGFMTPPTPAPGTVLPSPANPAVGVDTNIENAEEATSITVTGKQQTVGQLNNNNDQFFGIVNIEDNSNDTLDLLLDNTARVDGDLNVDSLQITGSASEVDELNLISGGERSTFNTVRDFQGTGVDTLTLTGTQGLGIVVNAMASAPGVDLLIDGEELGGTLSLGLNAAVLNGGNDDEVIGTDSASDRLAIFGAIGAGTNTTVDDFENIQFGIVAPSAFAGAAEITARTVEGEFSFANVSGSSNNIIVTNLSDDLTLTNLSGDTIITVGDNTLGGGSPIDQGINNALTFEGADDDDSIDVNITPFIGDDDIILSPGATDLLDPGAPTDFFIDISGFEDVTVRVSRQAELGSAGASDYDIDLRLDDADGFDIDAMGLVLDADVDDFVSDGGTDQDVAEVDGVVDSLVLTAGSTSTSDQLDVGNALLGSISEIDLTGVQGTFIGEVVNAVFVDGNEVDSANVDRSILIGDDDVFITLQDLTAEDTGVGMSDGDADSIDTNTIFRFTDGTATSGDADGVATWVIDNFVAGDFDNATLANYSVLNFAGLGLTNFTQLTVETGNFNAGTGVFTVDPTGSDTQVTDGTDDWRVVLIDVQGEDLLESENFNFSSTTDAGMGDLAVAPAIDPAMGMMDSFAFA